MRKALPLLMHVPIFIGPFMPMPVRGQEASDSIDSLKEAAEQGDADAQYRLDLIYERPEEVTHEFNEAAKLYQMAAERGHPKAKHAVGLMCDQGRGGLLRIIRKQ